MHVPLPSVSGVRVSLTVTIAHATERRAFAWCSCAPTSPHHLRQRLDLAGAGRAAPLTDVLVLLTVEQDEEESLAHRHRLPAARTVEQTRLERSVAFGLVTASRPPEHASMVNASAPPPQRRLPPRRQPTTRRLQQPSR